MGDTLRKKPHTNMRSYGSRWLSLSGTNGPLHVRRPSLIVGLHPIVACSSSLPSIASHLTARYLEMTFKWTVTVCEYREQGFMEPRLKIRPEMNMLSTPAIACERIKNTQEILT